MVHLPLCWSPQKCLKCLKNSSKHGTEKCVSAVCAHIRIIKSRENKQPKNRSSITTKYIYFDSANISRCWDWRMFIGRIGVPGKWAGSSRKTCEGVSFLVKLLAEARRLWSTWAPSQVLLRDFAKLQRYFTSNFGF